MNALNRFLRPLFRGVTAVHGSVARAAYPWLRLPPLRVTLMITSRCNLACPHCYVREELNGDETARLSLEEWKRVIDSIPRWMPVMLSGGEPFVAPDAMGILAHLLDTRHLVSVVTNGTALDEAKIRFLVGHRLRYLMVSLDGLAETHNRIRGQPSAFQRVEKLFRTLHAVKREMKARYPLTCIKTTATEDNYAEIPGLIDFAEQELRADHFALSLLVQNPLQQGFKLAEDLGDPRLRQGNAYRYPAEVRPGIAAMLARVLDRHRSSRMPIEIAPPLRGPAELFAYVEDPSRFGVRACGMPWSELTVRYDGVVTPCITYRIDNIRSLNYSVRNAMKHPRCRAFLSWFARTRDPAPCEGCCWGRHARKR